MVRQIKIKVKGRKEKMTNVLLSFYHLSIIYFLERSLQTQQAIFFPLVKRNIDRGHKQPTKVPREGSDKDQACLKTGGKKGACCLKGLPKYGISPLSYEPGSNVRNKKIGSDGLFQWAVWNVFQASPQSRSSISIELSTLECVMVIFILFSLLFKFIGGDND